MSYDDPKDQPETRWVWISGRGITIDVRAGDTCPEDQLRRKAAKMLLEGIMTPDFLAKIPD